MANHEELDGQRVKEMPAAGNRGRVSGGKGVCRGRRRGGQEERKGGSGIMREGR